jgi:4-carboxymuconolactone decarboxylase
MATACRLEEGTKPRKVRYSRAGWRSGKKVLGAELLGKSLASADDFRGRCRSFRPNIAGAIWTREGLTLQQRRLLNIALNRPDELKLHIKAALTNGLTREQIREALPQVAIYRGVPAGTDSTRIAREAFAELDQAKS